MPHYTAIVTEGLDVLFSGIIETDDTVRAMADLAAFHGMDPQRTIVTLVDLESGQLSWFAPNVQPVTELRYVAPSDLWDQILWFGPIGWKVYRTPAGQLVGYRNSRCYLVKIDV